MALAALSAFQARVHPLLSWAAFALPAVGTIALVVGAAGVALGRDELGDAFYLGLLTFFVGSLLFADRDVRHGGLLPRAGGPARGGDTPRDRRGRRGVEAIHNVASLACFTLGWVALGAQAVRLDRPLGEPKLPDAVRPSGDRAALHERPSPRGRRRRRPGRRPCRGRGRRRTAPATSRPSYGV